MSIVRSWGALLGGALLVLLALAVDARAQQQPGSAKPAPPAAPPAAAAPAAPAPPAPAPDYRVVATEAIHAVVLPMKGSYSQHQSAFERLGAYLAGRGISPEGPPFARYYSDPSVGEDDLVWEVGFKIPAGTKEVEAPFEVKAIPGAQSVVHVHRGSYDELASAWPQLVQWALSNGYQIAGPPTMIFSSFMPPEVELRLAVQR